MIRRIAIAVLALLFLSINPESPPLAQRGADEIFQSMLRAYDPLLLRRAEEMGLYDRVNFPVWREMNPYYIRGDFNGDGEMDVAFWIKEMSSQLPGVAIVHSTLDTLYIFGAGQPRPPGHSNPEMRRVGVDAWHIRHPGDVENHPYGTIHEIGVIEGVPFTFERETLEFIHLGKSAFVFYWSNSQYWEFWTAD